MKFKILKYHKAKKLKGVSLNCHNVKQIKDMQKNSNKILYENTKKLPSFFSDAQITKIIQTIARSKNYMKRDIGLFHKARDITLIMLLLTTGLRPREACYLRFDDFSSENMTIKIRGENNKQKKDRILPVSNVIIPFFKSYFSFSRARFWRGSQYLFPSFQNEKLSPERLKQRFREILKEANIYKIDYYTKGTHQPRPKYRLYTLRHTCFSKIYNKTHDIFLVSNLAGHSGISSSKVYIHADEDYLEYERNALNKLFKF